MILLIDHECQKIKEYTQKEKILDLLKDHCWHSFSELNRICYRYGARINELNKKGIFIESKKEEKIWYYRLKPNIEKYKSP